MMSIPQRRLRRSALAGAVFVLLGLPVVTVSPVGAGRSPGYEVPAGVEHVKVVAVGGQGGIVPDGFPPSGSGCEVTASLPVAEGDVIAWLVGGDGGNTDRVGADSPGSPGGAGLFPGGAGGGVTELSGSTPRPGTGGGGATAVAIDSVDFLAPIVAAGGGGATQDVSGGSGCVGNDAGGSQGFGTTPTAEGGVDPAVGGAGCLGNSGSANPPPGNAGQSLTGSPPGQGGAGGDSTFGGSGGGGGGGGVSGGGGGCGQVSRFGSGGPGSGAAGLSRGPDPVGGIAGPTFAAAPSGSSGSVAVEVVEISTEALAGGTVGAIYSQTLQATVIEVANIGVTAQSVQPMDASPALAWSLAADSDPLPGGVTLDPSGALSGTPTAPGTATVELAASLLNAGGDTMARTVVSLTVVIGAPSPTTSTTAVPDDTTSTTTPVASTSTTITGGDAVRSGVLPATGAGVVAPMAAAGGILLASGAGVALLAARRRRS